MLKSTALARFKLHRGLTVKCSENLPERKARKRFIDLLPLSPAQCASCGEVGRNDFLQ
ncbi:MAG: hypothetical protein KBG33_04030 [Paludibacteraceae bacterium]|nr:hypothetical protein [Paludibacteraceae bacterium]HOF98432.1 hypothetical protein [Paludibacteraceae bacterium]